MPKGGIYIPQPFHNCLVLLLPVVLGRGIVHVNDNMYVYSPRHKLAMYV